MRQRELNNLKNEKQYKGAKRTIELKCQEPTLPSEVKTLLLSFSATKKERREPRQVRYFCKHLEPKIEGFDCSLCKVDHRINSDMNPNRFEIIYHVYDEMYAHDLYDELSSVVFD